MAVEKQPPPGGLTPDKIRAYVRSGGAQCPFCGNDDGLQPSHPVYLGAEMIYSVEVSMECLSCKRKWKELYRLTNIEEKGP